MRSILNIGLCLILLVAVCGCNKTEAKTDELLDSMIELSTVESLQCSEEKILVAGVTLPDYSVYLSEVLEEAGEQLETAPDFEYELLSYVNAKVSGECEMTEREITVDLDMLDSEQVDFTDDELYNIAKETAFNAEIEEFCVEIIERYSIDEEEGAVK